MDLASHLLESCHRAKAGLDPEGFTGVVGKVETLCERADVACFLAFHQGGDHTKLLQTSW